MSTIGLEGIAWISNAGTGFDSSIGDSAAEPEVTAEVAEAISEEEGAAKEGGVAIDVATKAPDAALRTRGSLAASRFADFWKWFLSAGVGSGIAFASNPLSAQTNQLEVHQALGGEPSAPGAGEISPLVGIGAGGAVAFGLIAALLWRFVWSGQQKPAASAQEPEIEPVVKGADGRDADTVPPANAGAAAPMGGSSSIARVEGVGHSLMPPAMGGEDKDAARAARAERLKRPSTGVRY